MRSYKSVRIEESIGGFPPNFNQIWKSFFTAKDVRGSKDAKRTQSLDSDGRWHCIDMSRRTYALLPAHHRLEMWIT